ncbi:hypothetical protein [Nocardioides sp. cx-173]|uniref:hypothetical protein n=1 Tax=Nocardioides sp. cx-173 TaxID=2898796 RepID=UPI001E3B8FC9|nr:hypothetical protein [Nocardioides sp. cx-173]MCD4523802.1 hypothetical protein [Nocardioides sp. cx-173]UGB41876.1 hypothetical protein LQ940_21325 [Nocardioides sp. cx-173]
MLSQSSYPAAYVAASRDAVSRQLDAYAALPLSAADRAGFEPDYLRQLVLALDTYALHRSRGQEGKDGNPLNEVRLLCTSIREHDGVLTGEKSIKYAPDRSVLGLAEGEQITLDAAGFRRLADGFFDELVVRFPG